jgi:uncharacterized membrane protein
VGLHGADLAETPRAWSFVVVGATLLAAALLIELRPGRTGRIDPAAVAGFLAGQVALLAAAATALDTPHEGGAVVLGLGVLDSLIATAVYRRAAERDFVTVAWGTGALLLAAAVALLLDGTPVTLAWAALGATFAGLCSVTREERFLAGAAGFAGLALAHTLTEDAPLTHLFSPDAPRSGVLVAVAVAGAAAAIAAAAHGRRRRWAAAVAGALGAYGVSIAILSLTTFHTGHTVVSAFWGLIGLGLLYAGLTRYGALRAAGFAVFAVALGKLFLFDLSFLDSITRALSFLAVGAVLLVGGFFYQRLTVTLRAGSD